MQTSATAAPATVRAAAPVVAAPADILTLRGLTADVQRAQEQLAGALRRLESAAGAGPWRSDLVIAMEKGEAAGFWAREGIQQLAAHRVAPLMPPEWRR